MGALEFWTLTFPVPGLSSVMAATAEDAGFDGLVFADTQNLAGDPYAALVLAAARTTKLGLGTGVTNPVTRHPAVTASAIATVQVESGGRAVLGIGRGDSSLGWIGRPPAPVARFEAYLRAVQSYLTGEPVDQRGFASRLRWLDPARTPKVPVDVAATGPRMIAIGAVLAERVTFAVGADPHRIAWAVDVARSARRSAGLDPDGVSLGVYLNCAVHPEIGVARELVRGPMATFAHFSGMAGAPGNAMSEGDHTLARRIGADYDMAQHAQAQARHTEHLTGEFMDRFGVLGDPETVAARLRAIAGCGIDRLVLVGAGLQRGEGPAGVAARLLTGEVLPAVRAG